MKSNLASNDRGREGITVIVKKVLRKSHGPKIKEGTG